MYFLLGSVKELLSGFVSVLFPVEKADAPPQTWGVLGPHVEDSTKRSIDLKVVMAGNGAAPKEF